MLCAANLKVSETNTLDSLFERISEFGDVFKYYNFTPEFTTLVHQDKSRYSTEEKIATLKQFMIYFMRIRTFQDRAKFESLHSDIQAFLKKLPGIYPEKIADAINSLILPQREILSTIGNPANTNLNNSQRLQQIIAIFKDIVATNEIEAHSREVLLQQLKMKDSKGDFTELEYSQKYKLCNLLRLPELAGWEHILTELEKQFPRYSWTQKAA